MPRGLLAPGVMACLGLLVGCATYAPIPLAAPLALEPGHGLLLIIVDSNFEIDTLDIGRRLETSGTGVQYLLYDVPAGSYSWKQIYPANEWSARMRYVLYKGGDRVRREFEVLPGIINYPGHIEVQRTSFYWIRFASVNRSALAYEGLREMAPELLDAYRMEYSGFQRDDFLVEYQDRLEAREAAAAVEGGGP